MPEIKIKHVVSFSSEDKVHKAENMVRSETYRKWKCAKPGEKSASIVLQFEKATQVHSIDIGNESSAFVEVLVGRSSDSVNDFQVLLVASSFMSPLESRNEQHTNRVRMFGPDKLAQNLKDEKWDCVQIICTQPFNKNITYGLSFIKFQSPPEKNAELIVEKEVQKAPTKLGAFKIKYDEEEDETTSVSNSWKERRKLSNGSSTLSKDSISFASAAPAISRSPAQQSTEVSRKVIEVEKRPEKADVIKHVNKEKVVLKDAFGKTKIAKETPLKVQTQVPNSATKLSTQNLVENKASSQKASKKKPFHKLMEKVVFVLSGFVNPMRGQIRDKALEMGAKYKGDWDSSCTHLICAFLNTPKYQQVVNAGGIIVTKEWIIESHRKRQLLPWQKYKLGSYSRDSSDESASEEENITPVVTKKAEPKTNGGTSKKRFTFIASDSSDDEYVPPKNKTQRLSPPPKRINQTDSPPPKVKDVEKSPPPKRKTASQSPPPKKPALVCLSSETEDEETLRDYMADTDVDDSGGNTEDEILKCESDASKKKTQNSKIKENDSDLADSDSESLLPSKVDTSGIQLPELPNLFNERHFFFYGDFLPHVRHTLERYITAFNGVIENYMSNSVKYVITEAKWDKSFDEALSENGDLTFVKPGWIFKCKEAGKFVPCQPFIVTPGS